MQKWRKKMKSIEKIDEEKNEWNWFGKLNDGADTLRTRRR